MKTLKLSMFGAAVLLSTSAMANIVTDTGTTLVDGTKTFFKTATNPAAVSLEVGSLGYGANIAWAANDRVELQAGWAGGNIAEAINDNFDANGVNYQVETDFSNPYLGVQLRPAANWFTVGAGVIVPDNEIKVRANPSSNGTYRIGGVDYDQNEVGTLKGTLEHRNKLAPYLTVGFRPNIGNNWGVFGEVGATYLGKADANITASGDGTEASQARANALAAQAERDIEAKDYANWFPIVKVGATYRF
ncbi:outer membrane protein G1b [Moraxella bovoculi 237]|uniref:Outer membrane protein G1b n=1 Tax=Moraxella bovoculi 237 TaxID=743974 RepID=A0A066UCK1_9GAMM|nr:hypothetical protein [Moraxella bovoculi]KDN25126.1 outer membrane protein G1b [Moraxella bovoculi 237]NSM10952.1 hypothetical protein [Moraxella bovoculi]